MTNQQPKPHARTNLYEHYNKRQESQQQDKGPEQREESQIRQRQQVSSTNSSSAASTSHEEQKRPIQHPSSLDFERVVNQYSIQATLDRLYYVEPIVGSGSDGKRDAKQAKREAKRGTKTTDRSPLLTPIATKKRIAERYKDAETNYSSIDASAEDTQRGLLPPPPPPPPKVSFDTRTSSVTKRKPRPNPVGYSGRTATRWMLTALTGLLTGLSGVVFVSMTDAIVEWRSHLMDASWRDQQQTILLFVVYAAINLVLAICSSALCLLVAPEAVGSGIPEVKAYLNGVRVRKFSSLQLLFVTITATILSVSSGLCIGPEGPMVHIGAIMGAGCTRLSSCLLRILPPSAARWTPRLWSFVTKELPHFATDGERRRLVSVGAASGFAAAFGAPTGGLLFSMEELCSYFEHGLFLKTLVATALATFCLAVHHGNLSDYSIISLGKFESPDENIFLTRVEEFPLYMLMGVGGGVLGGLFCKCWKLLHVFKQKRFPWIKASITAKIAEVAFVSLLTSVIMYWIPVMDWTCRPVGADGDIVVEAQSTITERFTFIAKQFDCKEGQINEVATIFLGSRVKIIGDILTNPNQFHIATLLTVGFVFFPLMTLTLGVSLPTGVFMPTCLIGSCLGGAAGIWFQGFFEETIATSTFALLGTAALLAGVQRSTVSPCVILVEGTGQVQVLIPVIVTVVIARYVGDLITHGGLYETAIEVNQFPFLEHNKRKKELDVFQVRDVMSFPPVVLWPREKAATIVRLLRRTQHNGFPVVDPETERFLGLVRRDQLVALLECGVFEDDDEAEEDDRGINRPNRSSILARTMGNSGRDWTPPAGVDESPLMHQAYHIGDGRYEDIDDMYDSPNPLSSSKTSDTLHDDEFDVNSWLLLVRKQRELYLSTAAADGRRATIDEDEEIQLDVGDFSMPPVRRSSIVATEGLHLIDEDKALRDSIASLRLPTPATVGTNNMGNVYVKWLDSAYINKWVNVAAVMNRGTFCVTGFCPLSKVYSLFTSMGLRHLIVLGGEGGGRVVGMVTRQDLLKDHIEQRTSSEL